MRSFRLVFVLCCLTLASAAPHNPEEGGDFEGDMILPPEVDEVGFRAAVRDPRQRWTNGVVYIQIDPTFNETQIQILLQAMRDFEKETCIRFVEEPHAGGFVRIRKMAKGGGCSSHVGFRGATQQQSINLEPACFNRYGTILHEMMHSLGFHHEQSRYDRDQFVHIDYDNVKAGRESDFTKYNRFEITHSGTEYDFGSLMHYPNTAFAKDIKKPTILPLVETTAKMGQRTYFSATDLIELRLLYGCGEKDAHIHADGSVHVGPAHTAAHTAAGAQAGGLPNPFKRRPGFVIPPEFLGKRQE